MGIIQTPIVETGADFMKEWVGYIEDPKFFEEKFGKGKLHPGGPTCKFRGVDVLCSCHRMIKVTCLQLF